MNQRHPRPVVVKTLLALFVASAAALMTGCQTGYDRAMDYKDQALKSRENTAILGLGGSVTETTTTAEDGTVTVTRTTSLAPAPGGAPTSGGPTSMTLDPGARMDFGYYVRNTGAVPVSFDPASVMRPGGGNREVSPTEKLALLESYWGETGNFVPKSAYQQSLEIAARVALGYFIYDAGKAVIESNSNLASEALAKPAQIVEPTVIIP